MMDPVMTAHRHAAFGSPPLSIAMGERYPNASARGIL